jgi:phospholipase C
MARCSIARARSGPRLWLLGMLVATCALAVGGMAAAAPRSAGQHLLRHARQGRRATTPVKHLVVIFQENVAFDHYFSTYPEALNPPGEPRFTPAPGTPRINGLSGGLLSANPNAVPPFRLDRRQAFQCTNQHAYTHQQLAMHSGLMDRFVEELAPTKPGCSRRQVMGYFDGNTVTGLWNYAQHFALGDNFFATTIGPSTPGAINLVSGQTHGATPAELAGEIANGTLISDPDPRYDDCSLAPGDEGSGGVASLSGRNVGDLLSARGITWGWFEGGFRPTTRVNGKAVCGSSHRNIAGMMIPDYIPHHEPFQYYTSTANPHHLPPSSVAMVGHSDRANHQYDLTDFWRAAQRGDLPSVSFLKARHFQDGHDGKSDPLDEQVFLVETINRLQRLRAWPSMAIVIAYDDPGGWYDHVFPPILSQSNDARYDALLGSGLCGQPTPGAYLDRCGRGLRLPLLAISPWTQPNSVDHQVMDQASILRFIEENWRLGRIGDHSFDATASPLSGMFDFTRRARARTLFLNPSTGQRMPVAANGR